MRVRVKLMRNAGHWLTWNQKPREYTGRLSSSRTTKEDQPGMAYLFLPDDGPHLYEPKIKSVLDNEMRIVGLEKHEGAWVLQEWSCEVVGL